MMRPARLLPLLAALAALVLLPLLASAQRFPRELQDIRLYGKGETVALVFSQPYEGTPVTEFKPGAFSLSFSGTGSAKPVRSLRPVEESLYKEVKVVQNRYSTTVSFLLKDPSLNLEGKLGLKPNDNVLTLAINAPTPAPQPSPQAEASRDLLREMEGRITGGQGEGAVTAGSMAAAQGGEGEAAPLALGDLGEGQFFYSLVTMVLALVIIVAALYGVLYLYNRFVATRLRRFTGGHAIKQLASFHIGPRQRIVVLEINGEKIACGVTPHQITYLTHLDGKGPVGGRSEPTTGGTPGAQGGEPRETGALPPEIQTSPGDPVHQFAEVLKQKVRSLKRIN